MVRDINCFLLPKNNKIGSKLIAILILLGALIYKTGFQLMKWAYLNNNTGGETRLNFRWGAN